MPLPPTPKCVCKECRKGEFKDFCRKVRGIVARTVWLTDNLAFRLLIGPFDNDCQHTLLFDLTRYQWSIYHKPFRDHENAALNVRLKNILRHLRLLTKMEKVAAVEFPEAKRLWIEIINGRITGEN